MNKVLVIGVAAAFAAGMACGLIFTGSSGSGERRGGIFAGQTDADSARHLDPGAPSVSRGSIWTTKDFPTRLHEALTSGNERKRWRAINAIADDLDPAQIQAALAEVEKLHIRERPAILMQLLGRWAAKDPKGALSYAMSLQKVTERNQAVAAAIGGWAEQDPRGAEDYASHLPAGRLKDQAYQALIGSIAGSDPEHALQLAQALPSRFGQQAA